MGSVAVLWALRSFREGAAFSEPTLSLRATFTGVNDGYEVRLLALSEVVVANNVSDQGGTSYR